MKNNETGPKHQLGGVRRLKRGCVEQKCSAPKSRGCVEKIGGAREKTTQTQF